MQQGELDGIWQDIYTDLNTKIDKTGKIIFLKTFNSCSETNIQSSQYNLSVTFVTFLIYWPCNGFLLLLVSPDVDLVFFGSGLAYETYSGGGPSMYVYCIVCYRVIEAP